jgi:hypothetical protein
VDELINTLKEKSIIRSYIISESLIWSAWNAVFPIMAIYITSKVTGGTIESAGIAYSIHLVFRVVFEISVGKVLHNASDRKKFAISVIGLTLMSIAYAGFVCNHLSSGNSIFCSCKPIPQRLKTSLRHLR